MMDAHFKLWLLAFALCSCGSKPEERQDHGWVSQSNSYRNTLFYDFGDGSSFFATCDASPVFGFKGGDYGGRYRDYELRIDGQRWDLEIAPSNHGAILVVDNPKFADVLAAAKTQISFAVGPDWQRTLKPSPLLAKFVSDCRAMRKLDPDADGTAG